MTVEAVAWCKRSSDNTDKNVDAGPNTLKRTDVEWSQSRVLFVAPEFTKYQQYAIGFKNLGIQLWEIRKYKNGIVTFNEVKSPLKKESLASIIKSNPDARKVSEVII
ncbi:MAG: hypothetical protein WAZ77_22960 [Candidatus Nitrosopolaris sp.]